jgi:hypothetical protein
VIAPFGGHQVTENAQHVISSAARALERCRSREAQYDDEDKTQHRSCLTISLIFKSYSRGNGATGELALKEVVTVAHCAWLANPERQDVRVNSFVRCSPISPLMPAVGGLDRSRQKTQQRTTAGKMVQIPVLVFISSVHSDWFSRTARVHARRSKHSTQETNSTHLSISYLFSLISLTITLTTLASRRSDGSCCT